MAKRRGRETDEEEEESKNEAAEEYEQHRAQRIKENMDRMKKLGLLELSKKLKPEIPRSKGSDKPPPQKKHPSSDDPPRRSSRLKSMNPVNYSERRGSSKGEILPKNVEIIILEGEKPEFYAKEHKKLLGHYKNSWTLYEDGYDEDGQRMYDPDFGKSCHQCRQKTLGRHTECSKCKLIQGQFCGDCLYMRYGENVIETNENPSWICPVCRDICNCSRCRREKGWAPTGAIYKKVKFLGYKSVAHYLIMTKQKEKDDENHPTSVKSSEPSEDLTDGNAVSDESDDGKNESLEKHKDDEEPGSEDEDEDDYADDSE